MSRLHIDGFECGDALGFDNDEKTALSVVTTAGEELGFTGDYYCVFNIGSVGAVLFDDVTTAIVSLKLRLDEISDIFTIGINSDDAYLKITYTDTTYVTLGIYDGDHSLQKEFNYGISSQTNTFEFKAVITGIGNYTCYVRANGYDVINDSLTSGSETAITNVRLYSDSPSAYIDDFVIDDEDWIGITEIYQIKPYANGATNQWTNTHDSTNFEIVNNIPSSTSYYISTKTFDDIDLYKNYDIPVTGRTIRSLMLCATSLQAGGPPPTELIQGIFRIDSTNFEVESEIPGTLSTWKRYKYLRQESPKTRSAWTELEINDMETGVKLIAG